MGFICCWCCCWCCCAVVFKWVAFAIPCRTCQWSTTARRCIGPGQFAGHAAGLHSLAELEPNWKWKCSTINIHTYNIYIYFSFPHSPALLRGFFILEGFLRTSDWFMPLLPLVPGPCVSTCMLSSLSEAWLLSTFFKLMSCSNGGWSWFSTEWPIISEFSSLTSCSMRSLLYRRLAFSPFAYLICMSMQFDTLSQELTHACRVSTILPV